MDQRSASTRSYRDDAPIRVSAPHSYDGIGQALRSAFRDHRNPPEPVAAALNRLYSVD